MGNKLEVEFIRDANGRIDSAATLAQWHNDLAVYMSKEDADSDVISQAVDRFLVKNPSMKSSTLDTMASLTMNEIPNIPHESFEEVKERIKDFIRNSTEQFALIRGKNGGVFIKSRLNAEELARVETQVAKMREKAEAKKADTKAA